MNEKEQRAAHQFLDELMSTEAPAKVGRGDALQFIEEFPIVASQSASGESAIASVEWLDDAIEALVTTPEHQATLAERTAEEARATAATQTAERQAWEDHMAQLALRIARAG